MREVLLGCLFKIIARLRTAEISLISCGNFQEAAEIRKVQEKLSVVRDRLITAQLTEASHDLMHAKELLEETNNELQTYLSDRVAADRQLEAILEKIPGLIAFLGTIFI